MTYTVVEVVVTVREDVVILKYHQRLQEDLPLK